eukprot:TRINITY_DN9034_c0_g1_i1.p1 TRINITY_DN9034_c0_g1~~TRINITY_DN9034_c0_g1_i1.p1  ORF type:complete len:518 (-),score=97.28 TRINITY_DN9034_c0_g1_i1:114-1622(-)
MAVITSSSTVLIVSIGFLFACVSGSHVFNDPTFVAAADNPVNETGGCSVFGTHYVTDYTCQRALIAQYLQDYEGGSATPDANFLNCSSCAAQYQNYLNALYATNFTTEPGCLDLVAIFGSVLYYSSSSKSCFSNLETSFQMLTSFAAQENASDVVGKDSFAQCGSLSCCDLMMIKNFAQVNNETYDQAYYNSWASAYNYTCGINVNQCMECPVATSLPDFAPFVIQADDLPCAGRAPGYNYLEPECQVAYALAFPSNIIPEDGTTEFCSFSGCTAQVNDWINAASQYGCQEHCDQLVWTVQRTTSQIAPGLGGECVQNLNLTVRLLEEAFAAIRSNSELVLSASQCSILSCCDLIFAYSGPSYVDYNTLFSAGYTTLGQAMEKSCKISASQCSICGNQISTIGATCLTAISQSPTTSAASPISKGGSSSLGSSRGGMIAGVVFGLIVLLVIGGFVFTRYRRRSSGKYVLQTDATANNGLGLNQSNAKPFFKTESSIEVPRVY